MFRMLGPLLWVAAAVVLLAFLAYRIRVWWRENDDPAEGCHDLLSEYIELHRRGELSDEEFRSIKSRLFPHIGQGANPVAGATKPSAQAELGKD